MTPQIAKWIAVDCSNNRFRVWVLDADDKVIATLTLDRDIGGPQPGDFEATMLDAISPYLGSETVPVICCGFEDDMSGLQNTAGAKTPCAPGSADSVLKIATADPRLDVFILPGVSQDNPADIMLGQETQISGFLAEDPEFDGVLCLPGAHTKWVHISAGEIVSFRTFMTGELIDLLCRQSSLSHAVQDAGWDDVEYENAISDGMSSPQLLSARLFGLGADARLKGLPPETAKARLTGLLIGSELSGARPYWLGQNVAIIAEPNVSALYAAALRLQHVPAQFVSLDRVTLKGLTATHKALT